MFASLAEAAAYLNHEFITCLECHEKFAHLGKHVSLRHHMTADDYRKKYGIPHRYGLIDTVLHDTIAARQQAHMEDYPEWREKFVNAATRRPYSVHPPSEAQLGTIRNEIQPLGNRVRWKHGSNV